MTVRLRHLGLASSLQNDTSIVDYQQASWCNMYTCTHMTQSLQANTYNSVCWWLWLTPLESLLDSSQSLGLCSCQLHLPLVLVQQGRQGEGDISHLVARGNYIHTWWRTWTSLQALRGWPGCILTSNQKISIMDFVKPTRPNPEQKAYIRSLSIWVHMLYILWYGGVETSVLLRWCKLEWLEQFTYSTMSNSLLRKAKLQ